MCYAGLPAFLSPIVSRYLQVSVISRYREPDTMNYIYPMTGLRLDWMGSKPKALTGLNCEQQGGSFGASAGVLMCREKKPASAEPVKNPHSH